MGIFHVAAQQKNMSTLLIGINRHLDADIKDNNKSTALHIAAKNGWVEGVKALSADSFKEYCDLDIKDANGDTALNIAIKNGHNDVVKVLLEARSGDKEYQADPDVVNNSGDNSALISMKSENLEALKMILESDRIDPNFQDTNGDTILHIAAKNGLLEVMSDILEVMDDGLLNIKNKAGDTPISAAIHAHQHDSAKYLAEYSAENSDDYNFAIQDSSGLTAAQAAHNEGYDDITDILVGQNTEMGIQH